MKTPSSAERVPRLGDYAGFALNEAGRLWALSYDPSRLADRYHQCDAYVTAYQMRAVGNRRSWEERDPHNHTSDRNSLVGSNHRRASSDLDGWPSPSSGLGSSQLHWVLDGPVCGQCAGGVYDAHQARLASPEWHCRKAIKPL